MMKNKKTPKTKIFSRTKETFLPMKNITAHMILNDSKEQGD